MKSIHQRPPSVASRRQAGHWEGDLLVGGGQRSAIAGSTGSCPAALAATSSIVSVMV
jgi:hypothetical protein